MDSSEGLDLFDYDPRVRRRAAARYRPLANDPSYRGNPWPESLALAVQRWPLHMFGSANAWLVYVAPNPGPLKKQQTGGTYIEPKEPTLGGKPHPHVARFQKPNWTKLRNLVEAHFRGILTREEALASFMLVNFSETHSPRSVLGVTWDRCGFARVERALKLCRPPLIVAQNEDVYVILKTQLQRIGPEQASRSPNYARPRLRVVVTLGGRDRMLLAEAESHFAQGTTPWSKDVYLPLLTNEAMELA